MQQDTAEQQYGSFSIEDVPQIPSLLEIGRNCDSIRRANRMSILIDASSYFDALSNALEKAEHSIYIACWDIDSRLVLRRDDFGGGVSLRGVLTDIVERRSELNVYILSWDPAMIYMLDREILPGVKLGWQTSSRIHFHLDNQHPIGASHHQKFVVVDDRIAFVGGIDITRRRWDTKKHLPQDPRRKDSDANAYPPFHDIQAVVDGDAAAEFGCLFRERWRQATKSETSTPAARPSQDSDPWPEMVEPDLFNLQVALALTRAPFKNLDEREQIKTLYLDTISRAESYIYIENQFLTAAAIVAALTASLSKPHGPEVVVVLPKESGGWLEILTMDKLRKLHLRRLFDTDTYGRLSVYYPHVAGLGRSHINVHSKLLIADDRLLTVGSANISNRSMGLDTECNIVVESRERHNTRSIAHLKNRIVGHHLGVSPQRFGAVFSKKRSLVDTIASFQNGERSLIDITRADCEDAEMEPSRQDILDPESPTRIDSELDDTIIEGRRRDGWGGSIGVALAAIFLTVLAVAWQLTPLSTLLDPQRFATTLETLGRYSIAPFLAVGAFVALGMISFPITVLFVATSLIFDTVVAIIISLAGCLLSATTTYAAGALMGGKLVRRIAGSHVNGLSRWLADKGVVKVAIARLVPSAPFSVINFVAGASHLKFRDYLVGTAVGMMPGIVVISWLGDLAVSLVAAPSAEKMALLTGISVVVVLSGIWLYRRSDAYQRREDEREGKQHVPTSRG